MKVLATSQDGLWSVIEAVEYPGGIGRTRTADTIGKALKNLWEPTLITLPGTKSLVNHYVKVRTMDISGLPGYQPMVPLPVSAKDFFGKQSKQIPDYPHTCMVCRQPNSIVVLFSSTQHRGECPGPPARSLKPNRFGLTLP